MNKIDYPFSKEQLLPQEERLELKQIKKEFKIPSALISDFHSPYSTASDNIDNTITPAIPNPINPKLAKKARIQKLLYPIK